MHLPLVALADQNADGTYDRLDPQLGFIPAVARDSAGLPVLSWPSVPGRTYRIQYRGNFVDPWQTLPNSAYLAGPGETTSSHTDTTAAEALARFYRIELLPQ